MLQLSDLPIEWHFIGPLQSNKTRAVAESFAWVQSVDREKIASHVRIPTGDFAAAQRVLQVNVSEKRQRVALHHPEAEPLARVVAALPPPQVARTDDYR
jgi:uncharacterized pyridoxal phosphate-containing UPF0001 family protein